MAAQGSPSPRAHEALEKLCATYWYPLYAYVRRRGYSQHDAQDFVQSFFADLLERQSIDRVTRQKGKFRSFLLASLDHFLANARDRALARKRGGGQTVVSLDAHEAEERYQFEPRDDATPDKVFERAWAYTLLDQVLAQLAVEFAERGRRNVFERLEPFLIRGAGEETYSEVARDLGQSEEAVKKAVQRMRHRYRELFRELVSQTVCNESDLEDELRHLCLGMAAGR